jgi:hypothetical protein
MKVAGTGGGEVWRIQRIVSAARSGEASADVGDDGAGPGIGS